MQLAVALYNNNVDDDDELEFRKGDILTVLIENPNGFDGWLFCKHKDRYGLCPGNRLKLIQNTVSSPVKLKDCANSYSRLSTASMYDDLSIVNDTPAASISSNYEYDNSQCSDFISNLKPLDSSSESSLCSSGIYSTNEFQLSSSSCDFGITSINSNILSSIELDQLKNSFRKLSIHSSLIDKYSQIISKTNTEFIIRSFIIECRSFLEYYGCLLDRHTYKLIKEDYLYELENNKRRMIETSTKIIQSIKSIIDQQLKQKSHQNPVILNDWYRKLHLEPIAEISNEKLNTSISTANIHGNFYNKSPHTHMTTSKTCHSNFTSLSSNNYDSMNDFYSINPLVKCYYRHINEQTNLIIKSFSNLLDNDQKTSSFLIESKALIVAGHKLVFVLETLHEHVRSGQTSLIHLKVQLCEALTNLIQLLKQFSHNTSINIQKLMFQCKQSIKMIMNIVKGIKQQCASI